MFPPAVEITFSADAAKYEVAPRPAGGRAQLQNGQKFIGIMRLEAPARVTSSPKMLASRSLQRLVHHQRIDIARRRVTEGGGKASDYFKTLSLP
jgi:hypothetical protein